MGLPYFLSYLVTLQSLWDTFWVFVIFGFYFCCKFSWKKTICVGERLITECGSKRCPDIPDTPLTFCVWHTAGLKDELNFHLIPTICHEVTW